MDSSYEETDWFYPDQLPVRPGIYRTRQLAAGVYTNANKPVVIDGFSRWTGAAWCPTESTKLKAARMQWPGVQQTKMWKGIVKNEHQDGTD